MISPVKIDELFHSLRNDKIYKPFWNNEKREISDKLWTPNNTEKLNFILGKGKKDHSWFSIKKRFSSRKNHPNFQLPESEKLSKGKIKTLKLRIFPDKDEKEKLKNVFNQFKWYYNAQVKIFNKVYKGKITEKSKYIYTHERDRMRKYRFEVIDDKKKFIYDPISNDFPLPEWWDDVHNRIPRGAIKKFIMGINSALSNFKAGNISSFKMGFLRKKYDTEFFHFEDGQYPDFIRKIKNHYWYTDKNHKRKKIQLSDKFLRKRGLEVIHEKSTDKYYIHYPVENDWFPEDDRRVDNQDSFKVKGNRVISLDPGIRKFMVGYDPQGRTFNIGEKAKNRLVKLLLEIDKECSERSLLKKPIFSRTVKKWKKLKNLVVELHWKVINFLIKNYDIILLPDFRISQMVKGRKLGRMTKRLMYMFSFHSFKEKLIYKCSTHNKHLLIVDESYTSKTCGCCGELNNIGGAETFTCKSCKLMIDRDVNGARNILIKNITLR